jgi:hypothetical protein
MNWFKVDFRELFERHLCRHAEYGINVIHLAAVVVIYLALFALAIDLTDVIWPWLALPALYAVLLAFNVPLRVLAVCLTFLALFCATLFVLPPVPWWLCLVLIVVAHKGQSLSHKIYREERDMTAFNQKYKKGFVLFALLSLYELPILLNYLVFDRLDWVRPPAGAVAANEGRDDLSASPAVAGSP